MKSKTMLSIAVWVVLFTACNNDGSKTETDNKPDTSSAMKKSSVTEQAYGETDGKKVIEYQLKNPNGVMVRILNYGGTITHILVPDKNGELADVILGFDSLGGYLQKNNPYMGSLVGRYANRIANAKFNLDGKTYTLAANNNGNSLHGGLKGFDKVVWKSDPVGDSSLKLIYDSKDGEEGYPGNLHAEVVYTLTPNNELKIDYTASTDKATPINLTNHSYYNLSGGKDSTVMDHVLMLKADKYTAANNKLIPTGKLPPVKGTAMDFTAAKRIANDFSKVPGGYDHNWVLNKNGNALELIGTLYHPASGRFMEIYTTQPGIQFYTGNFLDGTLTGKGGRVYNKHAGLCLETQHFPDSPNQPSFPNSILKPGVTYSETTIYKFSTK